MAAISKETMFAADHDSDQETFARSRGDRGIITLASTAKNGTLSKILCTLQPGAKVSISRNDIDTIVTEYGVAMMRGKTAPLNTLDRVRFSGKNGSRIALFLQHTSANHPQEILRLRI